MSYAGVYYEDEDLRSAEAEVRRLQEKNDSLRKEVAMLRQAIDATLPPMIDALDLAARPAAHKAVSELTPEEAGFRAGLSASHSLFKRIIGPLEGMVPGRGEFDIPSMVDLMRRNQELEERIGEGNLGPVLAELMQFSKDSHLSAETPEEKERWRSLGQRINALSGPRTPADPTMDRLVRALRVLTLIGEDDDAGPFEFELPTETGLTETWDLVDFIQEVVAGNHPGLGPDETLEDLC